MNTSITNLHSNLFNEITEFPDKILRKLTMDIKEVDLKLKADVSNNIEILTSYVNYKFTKLTNRKFEKITIDVND